MLGQKRPHFTHSRLLVRMAAFSDIGSVRRENQDAFEIDQEGAYAIVADGMGGHHGGALAATLATTAARQVAEPKRYPSQAEAPPILDQMFAAASDAVCERCMTDIENHLMGTTLVAAVLTNDGCVAIAHAGDSRAYHFRNGRLRQLTNDHVLAAFPELAESMGVSPRRAASMLTRGIGIGLASAPDVTVVPIAPGDRILLCTDGLHGLIDDWEITTIFNEIASTDGAAEHLVDAAIEAGGHDNVTCIVMEFDRSSP